MILLSYILFDLNLSHLYFYFYIAFAFILYAHI